MTLRDRKKPGPSAEPSPAPSPTGNRNKLAHAGKPKVWDGSMNIVDDSQQQQKGSPTDSQTDGSQKEDTIAVPKKLPRVILRVGPPPSTSPGP